MTVAPAPAPTPAPAPVAAAHEELQQVAMVTGCHGNRCGVGAAASVTDAHILLFAVIH